MDKIQKPKRVFLIGWYNDRAAFVKAAQEMQTRGYEIAYWTVSNKQAIGSTRGPFKQTQFHWHNDAMKLVPPPEINEAEFAPPSEDLIEKLYEIESVLVTMKQFYKLSGSMLAKKHLFHRLIQYWYGVIQKYKPEAIFFVVWPHSVYDYTIYSLAKFLKIKTIMFEHAGMSDRYLLAVDLKQGSQALREEYHKNLDRQYRIEDLSPDIRKFYEWHIENKSGGLQPQLIASLKNYGGVNRLKRKINLLIHSVKNLTFFPLFVDYLARKVGPNMRKEYINLQTAPDYNRKFIYLPLNYQPEGSSSPQGGVFVDQILMIKMLSYCLPTDWLIYVKEHPIQWASGSSAYFDFRYRGYYEEISRIKSVKIVPLETSSYELIANSQAVATISGTAGFEALLRLKPVLLFGYIWYRDCPGSFQARSAEACALAMDKIKSGFKVEQQQLINYLVSLDKVSFHLNIERLDQDHSKLTEEDMAKTIINVMLSEAEKNY